MEGEVQVQVQVGVGVWEGKWGGWSGCYDMCFSDQGRRIVSGPDMRLRGYVGVQVEYP